MLSTRAAALSGRWRSFGSKAPGLHANWCENIQFNHSFFKSPEDVIELQQAIAQAETRIRFLGSGHSFTPAAASEGTCISLAMMRNVLDLDTENMTVTAQGGVTYGDLCQYLAPIGAALKNIPSLPHVSVAGSISTGTHGSGMTHGNLLKHVARIQYVKADGELVEYSRGEEQFESAVCGLGAHGAVSEITLDIVPSYQVSQHAYADVPLEQLQQNFHSEVASCDSFSAMINFGTGTVDSLMKRYFDHESEKPAPEPLESHLGGSLLREPMVFFEAPAYPVAMTHEAPWHDALSFFMDDCRPSNMPYVALQTEFMVPLECAVDALQVVREVTGNWRGWPGKPGESTRESPGPVIHNECRVVPADQFSASPFYQRDTLCVHFTMGADQEVCDAHVAELEEALRPFQPRPHWGKVYTMSGSEIRENYGDGMQGFDEVRKVHDPEGKFSSDWLEKHVLADGSTQV